MGQTKAWPWRQVLHEALDRYRELEAQGGDMVEGGGELARAVELLLAPPPCSPPRKALLRGTEPLTNYGAGPAAPLDDPL